MRVTQFTLSLPQSVISYRMSDIFSSTRMFDFEDCGVVGSSALTLLWSFLEANVNVSTLFTDDPTDQLLINMFFTKDNPTTQTT